MAKRKKLLVCTIGNVGRYKETTYNIDGELVHSAFILDAIIRTEAPDQVLIYGTAGSGWEDLYTHIASETDDSHMADELLDTILQAREQKQNAPVEVLNDLSGRLTACFQSFTGRGILEKVERISVQMLRYGGEPDVTAGNYSMLMKSFDAQLDPGCAYTISFDITHGFRSIPFFNYAILEYFRCLLPDGADIGTIYYGNLENKDENGVTCIERLTMVRDVMALTHAVEEFKHTGRTSTLAALLTQPEDAQLRGALEDFNWAMQCNSIDRLNKAIAKLFMYTEEPMAEQTLTTDARKLLRRVLREGLLGRLGQQGPCAAQWRSLGRANIVKQQLQIARWLCSTENYGQASLVATEALLGSLIHGYLAAVPADRQVRGAREQAECAKQMFERMSQAPATDTALAVSRLYQHYDTIRIFRNIYAHNLATDTVRHQDVSAMKPADVRKSIGLFIDEVEGFDACVRGSGTNDMAPGDLMSLMKWGCGIQF